MIRWGVQDKQVISTIRTDLGFAGSPLFVPPSVRLSIHCRDRFRGYLLVAGNRRSEAGENQE